MMNQWVVYGIQDAMTLTVLYIGSCELRKLMTLPDWNGNPEQSITLSVLGTFPTSYEARNFQYECVKVNDLTKTMRENRYRFVRCVETGEIFKTMAECAKAHELSQSNLANHLLGKAGYKSVKGKHYVRV